jgi:hypothetical protein
MFYREPELPIDPPEDRIFTTCDYCKGEIYEGESYYRIDGQDICVECLRDFSSDYFADCIEEAIYEAA